MIKFNNTDNFEDSKNLLGLKRMEIGECSHTTEENVNTVLICTLVPFGVIIIILLIIIGIYFSNPKIYDKVNVDEL